MPDPTIEDDPLLEPDVTAEDMVLEPPNKESEHDEHDALSETQEQQREAGTSESKETQKTDESEAQTAKTDTGEAKDEEEATPPVEDKEADKERNFAALRTQLKSANQKIEEQGAALQKLTGLKQELDAYRAEQQQQQTQEQTQSQKEKDEEAFNENPALYLKGKLEAMEQGQAEQTQLNETQQTQVNEYSQLMNDVSAKTQQFVETQPDYPKAADYLMNRRFKEYELSQIPQSEWMPRFQNETVAFFKQHMDAGRNPAEVAYQFATFYGYQPEAEQTTDTTQQTEGQDTGQEADKGGSKPAKKSIADIEREQEASQSLAGGASPEESLLKAAERMSSAEFDKYWDDLEKLAEKEEGRQSFSY